MDRQGLTAGDYSRRYPLSSNLTIFMLALGDVWLGLLLTGTGPVRGDHINLILGLSGLLLVLCAVIGTFYGLRRWWQRQQQEEASGPEDLANFHALYEEGELSQEELERVRQVVENRPAATPTGEPPLPPEEGATKPDG